MHDPAGPPQTLDPKLDIVFSLLFGADKNRHLLIALLNDVLQPASAIVSVEVLPREPDTVEVEDKVVVLDLRVRLASGEQVDVEMQTRRHPALRARVLYYWGRMYTSQLQRGSHYTGLKRCAVILITDFRELDCPGFHSVFEVRDRAEGQLLSDHLELHVVELPKLPSLQPDSHERGLTSWCRFLSAETDEQREALAMQNPILKEAKEALEELSADRDVRERANRRYEELMLQRYGAELERAEARAQGLAEGRAEGRAEGAVSAKRETLRRLLTLKFGSPSADVDGRLARANEAELDTWIDRVLVADTAQSIFETS